jgi:hypothetical protein
VLLVFLCFQFPKDGISQTFQYKIRVDEVDMQAPSSMPDGKIKILRDYDPNPMITGPAWKYPATEMPVAFLSGFAPMVTAKFDLGGCTKTIWAKGDGPGSFDVPAKQLSQGNYPSTALQSTFPSAKVDFYEPFEIIWSISNSPNGPWVKAGSSKHPLYISHATTALSSSLQVFHSLIYYGCKNAKGLKIDDDIVEAVYNGTFLSRKLIRKDSPTRLTGMTYWLTKSDPTSAPYPNCFETKFLLKFEDGRCNAWADFFIDMLKSQGINEAVLSAITWNGMMLDPSKKSLRDAEKLSFFGTQSTFVDPEFPGAGLEDDALIFIKNYNIENTIDFNIYESEYDPNVGNFINTSKTLLNSNKLNLAPSTGVKAQGNDNPQSSFINHAVVKFTYSNGASRYFDPSYGTPIIKTQNEWENGALAGVGSRSLLFVDIDVVPFKFRRLMWVYETNHWIQQCNFTF